MRLPGLSVHQGRARRHLPRLLGLRPGTGDFTAYQYIDITPRGRDESETGGMGWLRHHDRYDDPKPFVQPWDERPGITGPPIPR
jgi:hypothetical protein